MLYHEQNYKNPFCEPTPTPTPTPVGGGFGGAAMILAAGLAIEFSWIFSLILERIAERHYE